MHKALLNISLFLSCAGSLVAQTVSYRFINFSAKDGLLDKVVYNATQDRRGYMWFGTATGLYRYDGHRFRYFRSPIDKAGSNISNILQGILCDSSGHLWLGSFTTLQWYDPLKNRFWQPDLNKPENKKFASSYFYNFSEGKYIWCSTARNYVYRFNKQDSTLLSLAPGYPAGASTTSLYTIEKGNYLYDVHPEGIYQFELSGRFTRFVAHLPADISNAQYSPANNTLSLCSYENGLLTFTPGQDTSITTAYPANKLLKGNYLYSAAAADNGVTYVGATGLFILDRQGETLLNSYELKNENEFSFGAAKKVVNIFTDRERNRWFCSHNGLSMMPWQNDQVKTMLLKDEVTGFITEAFGVYQDPGTSNLLLINTTSRGLQYADLTNWKVSTIPNPSASDQLKKRITALVNTPDKKIFASDDQNFFIYNPSTRTLAPYSLTDQYGKPIRQIGRNLYDRNGTVFISTYNNGFYTWDYPGGKLLHHNKWEVLNTSSDTKDNQMAPCIADSKGNIWFTGSNGIYEYRQADKKYYQHVPPGSDDLPTITESRYIAEDRNGHIWVTTINNGLYELATENGKDAWKNYNINSGIGLPSDYCEKILRDPTDSILWISNGGGLLKFDPVQRRVVSVINMQNGLYGEGGGYTFAVFPDKKLVQLFYGALNVIDLNTYRKNSFKPVVQLNSVKVMNEEQVYQFSSGTETLKLPYNRNFLQFEFAALLFNNANQSQYAYRLEGADKDWVYSGQVNTVAYSGLRPGTYTFRVKGAGNDGVWGPETTLKIVIRPPFYARWWFITICALLAATAIYRWNRMKIIRTKKEEQLKASFQNKIAETEMKALRAQMNPHFIFNSLNSIQKFILKNEHFEASQYLTKFSRLIRLILDHSNQDTIQLSSELDLLRLYVEMESLRFDNRFDYRFRVDEAIQSDTLELPSMLIQPYLENAIWHGLLHKKEKGRLDVHFSVNEPGMLTVTIDDDGIGREKAAELKSKQVLKKKSYGMQITGDRIDIINRNQHRQASCRIIDKKDPEGQPAGTTVVLTIPVNPLYH